MRFETDRNGRRGHPDMATNSLARGLGIFSLALGLVQLVAPRALTRPLGQRGHEGAVRLTGVREIAKGTGILMAKDPTPWIWARLAGDALDLAMLTAGLQGRGARPRTIGLALASVAGIALLDYYCARTLSRDTKTPLPPARDYRSRSGFPRPVVEMRGIANAENVAKRSPAPAPSPPVH